MGSKPKIWEQTLKIPIRNHKSFTKNYKSSTLMLKWLTPRTLEYIHGSTHKNRDLVLRSPIHLLSYTIISYTKSQCIKSHHQQQLVHPPTHTHTHSPTHTLTHTLTHTHTHTHTHTRTHKHTHRIASSLIWSVDKMVVVC